MNASRSAPLERAGRTTESVLRELRDKMDETVVSYPSHIYRIEGPPIVGTAFFPGGCGLWSGAAHFAAPPEYFPIAPVMVVAHNYSGAAGFEELRKKGGEYGFWWRDIVTPLLEGAGIRSERAFFTNALMGLKEGLSVGDMRAPEAFEVECSQFLREQIRIVAPSAIVAFGDAAYRRVRRVEPSVVRCIHPSAREFIPLSTRASKVRARAAELSVALQRQSEPS